MSEPKIHGSKLGRKGSRVVFVKTSDNKSESNKSSSKKRGGIYRSFDAPELLKSEYVKTNHNRHADWNTISPGDIKYIIINNPRSPMHGKKVKVERLKNGSFRILHKSTVAKKPFFKTEKPMSVIEKLAKSEDQEYDSHGRPTPLLIALRQHGFQSKNDALKFIGK